MKYEFYAPTKKFTSPVSKLLIFRLTNQTKKASVNKKNSYNIPNSTCTKLNGFFSSMITDANGFEDAAMELRELLL